MREAGFLLSLRAAIESLILITASASLKFKDVFFLFCLRPGPVLGRPRGHDRARRLQRDASSGQGGGLQKHVGGGRPAQERRQDR